MSDTTYVVAMMNGGYEVKHVQRALEIFTGWEDCANRVKTVFTRVVPCNDQSRRKLTEAMGYPVEAVMPNATWLYPRRQTMARWLWTWSLTAR